MGGQGKETNRSGRNLGLIIGFVLLWNSGFIGAEYGLPYAGVFSLLFFRYVALTVIIALYLFATKQSIRRPWSDVWPQMLIGVLAHGVWLSCALLSIDYGVPAGIVALVVALQPLATGALSGLAVGEHTPWNRWLALMIGFSGVALPVVLRVDFENSSEVFAWFIPLGAVVAITIASLFQRRLHLTREGAGLSVPLTLLYQSLATALAMALPAIFLERLAVQWNPRFIGALLWLVLAVSLGAYSMMWILIERIDATKVASLFYLGPPVTMAMAWLAFGDRVELVDVIGMVLVLAGVLLTYVHASTEGSVSNNPAR